MNDRDIELRTMHGQYIGYGEGQRERYLEVAGFNSKGERVGKEGKGKS